ncbi:MAG: type III pantothenate kinase [Halomonadaceae bacterium]|nr:MAG: type III pantothenate kinase [Halomonadaceae bacterium]
MILQLDAGNSRIKWRLLDPVTGEAAARGVVTHGEHLQLPEALAKPQEVQLASVAGKAQHDALVEWVKNQLKLPVHEASTQQQQGCLRNSYQEPVTMGVDRWLAMLSASHRFAGGVAVLDAGSALTLDYVAADGHHLGGYILPGVTTMARSLKQDTARVPFQFDDIVHSASTQKPGQCTQDCVSGGLVWLMEQLMAGVRRDMEHYRLAQLVITGGDGRLLCPQPQGGTYIEPELVLDGLGRYWQLQRRESRGVSS